MQWHNYKLIIIITHKLLKLSFCFLFIAIDCTRIIVLKYLTLHENSCF